MNTEFKLPALGENVAGGDVVSVLVREGDVIAANDCVLEIETDKGVVEIPCPHGGKLTRVLVTKGEAVKVGQPLLTLETEPAGSESPRAAGGIRAQRGWREPAVPPGQLGEDAYGYVRRESDVEHWPHRSAAQMSKSSAAIPHMTNFDDADVTELERIRKTTPPAYLGPAVRLTPLAFALKAVALALRQHPSLNASLDEEKGKSSTSNT